MADHDWDQEFAEIVAQVESEPTSVEMAALEHTMGVPANGNLAEGVWGIVMFRYDYMLEVMEAWEHLLEEHEDCEDATEFLDDLMGNLVGHISDQVEAYRRLTERDDET